MDNASATKPAGMPANRGGFGRVFAGAIIGSIIMSLWFAASWATLPWHKAMVQSYIDALKNGGTAAASTSAPATPVPMAPAIPHNPATPPTAPGTIVAPSSPPMPPAGTPTMAPTPNAPSRVIPPAAPATPPVPPAVPAPGAAAPAAPAPGVPGTLNGIQPHAGDPSVTPMKMSFTNPVEFVRGVMRSVAPKQVSGVLIGQFIIFFLASWALTCILRGMSFGRALKASFTVGFLLALFQYGPAIVWLHAPINYQMIASMADDIIAMVLAGFFIAALVTRSSGDNWDY